MPNQIEITDQEHSTITAASLEALADFLRNNPKVYAA